MIIWEVYDYYDEFRTRMRFYTTLEGAIKFFINIHKSWAAPCLKAWNTDDEGNQCLLFAHNGSVLKYAGDQPCVSYTCEYIQSMLDQAVERREE